VNGTYFRILGDDLVARVTPPRSLDLISIRTGTAVRIEADSMNLARQVAVITLSPDGRQVAFTVPNRQGTTQIMVAAVDGSGARLVGAPACGVSPDFWLPGGQAIFGRGYDCTRDRAEILVTPTDGSRPRVLEVPYWPLPTPANDGQSVLVGEWKAPTHHITRIDLSKALHGKLGPK
jgi:hypothetical protein